MHRPEENAVRLLVLTNGYAPLRTETEPQFPSWRRFSSSSIPLFLPFTPADRLWVPIGFGFHLAPTRLFLHQFSLFLTDPALLRSLALLLSWIKMRKNHVDVLALVSLVVLLLVLLEFVSIWSLELIYYISIYLYVCAINVLGADWKRILIICLLEYLLQQRAVHAQEISWANTLAMAFKQFSQRTSTESCTFQKILHV